MAILGNGVIGDCQVQEIISLLKDGELYAGSYGSFKEGCSAHTYMFTCNKIKVKYGRGEVITQGAPTEMSSR